MLVHAARVLRAPDDPGTRGLWGVVALILLIALVAAHVRVLRAVARRMRAEQDDRPPAGGTGSAGARSEAATSDAAGSPRVAGSAGDRSRPQADGGRVAEPSR